MNAVSSDAPAEVIDAWLRRRLGIDALSWLETNVRAAASGDRRRFLIAFGLTRRRLGLGDLNLVPNEIGAAEASRVGWRPNRWTVAQAARTRLLLALPSEDSVALVALLDEIFASADIAEMVALYSSLPFLPHPASHARRASEGVRANIKAVFLAIAHDNPYPSEQLDDAAWNQLVMKCLFVGATLDPVVGLDLRANPALARMLLDFASERKAAGRPIPPELWRCVGPFANSEAIGILRQALTGDGEGQRMAAALALHDSADPAAADALRSAPELAEAASNGAITWRSIAGFRD